MIKITFGVIVIILLIVLLRVSIKAYINGDANFMGLLGVIASLLSILVAVGIFIIPTVTEIISRYFSGISLTEAISFPDGCAYKLRYNGHTYCICTRNDVNTFKDAENLCEKAKGHLAVINDADENKALYDHYMTDYHYKSAYFGYTDEDSVGIWHWVDGSETDSEGGYHNWEKGEPYAANPNEHYALFWHKDSDYKWNSGDFGKDPDTKDVNFLIEWER